MRAKTYTELESLEKTEVFENSPLNFEIQKIEVPNLFTNEPIGSYHLYNGEKYLATVGEYYTPSQPVDVYKKAQALYTQLKENGVDVKFNKGAVRENGKLIEFAMDWPVKSEPVVGDTIKYEIVVSSGNDGKRPLAISLLGLRLVCENGMTVPKMVAKARSRHTRDGLDRLNPAVFAEMVNKSISSFNNSLAQMAKVKLEYKDAGSLLDKILAAANKSAAPELDTPEISKTMQKHKESILGLYADNDGNAFPEIRNSAYALYNAVTNYIDHHAPLRAGTTREQYVDGRGGVYKKTALDVILEYGKSRVGAAVLDDILNGGK